MREPDGITGDVTLARLLETYPGLLPTLVEFHPHFRRIESRLRRRLMAPRVTLEQAAAMAGVPVDLLLTALRRAAVVTRPAAAVADVPPATAVLDVRGLEPPQPMLRVLGRAEALLPGGELEVRHDRRPLFLYPQLEERGFTHETDEPEPGVVRIRIRRGATAAV